MDVVITVVISAVLLALFILAIRHIVKKGTCGCDCKSCHGACSGCSHCASTEPKQSQK